MVRTERGREIIRGAVESGYLELKPAELWKLEKSQENLYNKKAEIWGRLVAMRLAALRTPRFRKAYLFRCWRTLTVYQKIASVFGTLRRVFTKRIRMRPILESSSAVPVKPAFKIEPDLS